jgi:hypothetical protein
MLSMLNALILFLCCCITRPGPAQTEGEIRDFLAAYAQDLNAHRSQSIINRYDQRGAYMHSGGKKSFKTFDSIKETYENNWVGPFAFEWEDMSIEVLSPKASVVTGFFKWQSSSERPAKTYSYTALLVKDSGEWRIRLEDEILYMD